MHQQQALTTAKPSNNIDAFNVLKVIAMVGMPFVHILENYDSFGALTEDCYRFSDCVVALTVFGPSVFMFCMGLGLAKDTSSKRLFKSGVQMLLISLPFNILRMSIPASAAVFAGMASWMDLFCSTISSDIYSFVGIFYIFYSIVIKLKSSPEKLLFVAAVMLAINCTISSCGVQEINLLTTLSGHFISISANSYFPLFGWAIYPCLGIFVAKKVLPLPNKDFNKTLLFASLFGFVLLLSTTPFLQNGIIVALSEFACFSSYHFTHALLIMAITLITLASFYFLYQPFSNTTVMKKIASFAPLLLPFYIFQWLATSLITGYYAAIRYMITGIHLQIKPSDYLLISLVVTALCMILTYKKGFSFSRWLFRISDFTRWGRKKQGIKP